MTATRHRTTRRRSRTRANGEGTLYRRSSDGLWVAALHLPSGRRKVLYGRTKDQVRAKLDRLKADILTGTTRHTDERQSLADFLTQWLETVQPNVRPNTYKVYSSMLRTHVIPALGTRRLTSVNIAELERFFLGLALAPRSTHMVKAVLRMAFNDAIRWGYLSKNPAALADTPRVSTEREDFIGEAEAQAIITAFRGHPYETLVTTAIGTGLRQGELLALRWDDVDLEGRSLLVRATLQPDRTLTETKTERSRRRVPLADFVVDALRVQADRQNTRRLLADGWRHEQNLVFTNDRGEHLRGTVVTDHYKTVLAKAGLPRRRFHDLRHAYSSMLLAAGVDMRTIMELMGHSNMHTTATVYTHVVPELGRAAADKLEGLFGVTN